MLAVLIFIYFSLNCHGCRIILKSSVSKAVFSAYLLDRKVKMEDQVQCDACGMSYRQS